MTDSQYITWLFQRARIEWYHDKFCLNALRLAMTYEIEGTK